MSATDYAIAFSIAGRLSDSFSTAFGRAGTSVSALQERMSALNERNAKLGALIDARQNVLKAAEATKTSLTAYKECSAKLAEMRDKVSALSAEYNSAKTTLTKYGRAINSSEKISDAALQQYAEQERKVQALEQELKLATKETETFARVTARAEASHARASQAFARSRSSMKGLNKAQKTTGVSTSELIRRQEALARSIDLTKRSVAAQEKAMKSWAAGKDAWSKATGAIGELAAKGTLAYSALKPALTQAISLEDAFADIAKVADFDSPQGLKDLQNTLQKMSLKDSAFRGRPRANRRGGRAIGRGHEGSCGIHRTGIQDGGGVRHYRRRSRNDDGQVEERYGAFTG